MAIVAAACLLTSPVAAEVHEVKMLTRGDAGAMVYEPAYLEIAPGDTVQFIAAQGGHNAASIDGFVPSGYAGFKGQINEEIRITLDQPGFYGVKCSPHFAMGMVMLIRVGETDVARPELPADLPQRAKARFDDILEDLGQ
ncbi:pseudoazurin [Rhodovibrio salinarum]|nr:pseudoazurin [Rhodovibrio salinarum]